MSLLREVEFPEHVLVERVVDVHFDPVQTYDALFELFGELTVYSHATRRGIHFCDDRVGPSARFSIIVGADGVTSVTQVFGKESEVEECEIADVFVAIATKRW